MQVTGRETGRRRLGKESRGLFSLSSMEKRLGADVEDLVSTTDFLRLITQSTQVQGPVEKYEGEMWRKASS